MSLNNRAWLCSYWVDIWQLMEMLDDDTDGVEGGDYVKWERVLSAYYSHICLYLYNKILLNKY